MMTICLAQSLEMCSKTKKFSIIAAMVGMSSGCVSIPAQPDPIQVRQYLSEKGLEDPGSLEAIRIAPVAIRAYRPHRVIVDVVVEGPAWPALDITNCLVSAVRNAPEDWIEIVKPNGELLDLVPLPSFIRGSVMDARTRSIPLGDSLTRLLGEARAGTPLFETIPRGLYQVRLLSKVADQFLHSPVEYEIDTRWHAFEIVADQIQPASSADMQQIYLAPQFRRSR